MNVESLFEAGKRGGVERAENANAEIAFRAAAEAALSCRARRAVVLK